MHRVIDGATHESLIADEEHAAATTQAILDVVSSVRSELPAGQVIRRSRAHISANVSDSEPGGAARTR